MSVSLTQSIRNKAIGLGFDLMGVSDAGFLEKEARYLEQWLKKGAHGTMGYLENHFDKRTDPRLLVPGAKTVISVLHNYFPQPQFKQPPDAPKISTYAWGEDYHTVLKGKLYALLNFITETVGETEARVFTDSAPVMDKAWAARSGLGWMGKNTNLIHPKKGSWFFIGEIILDLKLEPDGPIKDYCGTCTACIDACPTGALEPYQIDAHKCISYLTIELKDSIPPNYSDQMEGWAFGCDICQDVCPWNRFSKAHSGEEFRPLEPILAFTSADWLGLSKNQFKKLTKKSALSRVRFEKMIDNVEKSQL